MFIYSLYIRDPPQKGSYIRKITFIDFISLIVHTDIFIKGDFTKSMTNKNIKGSFFFVDAVKLQKQ